MLLTYKQILLKLGLQFACVPESAAPFVSVIQNRSINEALKIKEIQVLHWKSIENTRNTFKSQWKYKEYIEKVLKRQRTHQKVLKI